MFYKLNFQFTIYFRKPKAFFDSYFCVKSNKWKIYKEWLNERPKFNQLRPLKNQFGEYSLLYQSNALASTGFLQNS